MRTTEVKIDDLNKIGNWPHCEKTIDGYHIFASDEVIDGVWVKRCVACRKLQKLSHGYEKPQ